MDEKKTKQNNSKTGINLFKKKQPKRLSLNLHTMPKTETGHFQKWLVLGFLIFVLIILLVLFFI
jgi:hypothetical protein